MVSATRKAIATLLILGGLSCASRPELPPFLVLSGPKDVVRLEVADEDGNLLWILEADTPQTLDVIRYGEVPADFRQLEPADGSPPRALERGEWVNAETSTLTRLFTHTGVANSVASMEILNYSMELLEPRR